MPERIMGYDHAAYESQIKTIMAQNKANDHSAYTKRIPDKVRQKLTSDFGLIAEYLSRKRDPDRLEALLRDNIRTINHPEEFLGLLSEITNNYQYKIVADKLKKEEEEHLTMCIVTDKLINEGVQQGLKQGLEQGLEQGRLLLAKAFMKDGYINFEVIAKYLDMPVDTLQQKLNELDQN